MRLIIELADLDVHWPGRPERSLPAEVARLMADYDSAESRLSSAGTYVHLMGGHGAGRWSFTWRITGLEAAE